MIDEYEVSGSFEDKEEEEDTAMPTIDISEHLNFILNVINISFINIYHVQGRETSFCDV